MNDPRPPRRPRVFLAIAALLAIAGLAAWVTLRRSPYVAAASHDCVDEGSCAGCHEAEAAAWRGSHHDLAMQAATDSTVLGDFNGATVRYGGVTTRFSRDGGRFMVHTDGPDGVLVDFEVTHVFGVDPLQQVLVRVPRGRLQALSIAWDVKQRRWFHLYPGETIVHGDELHWTARAQNWNFMCAECHATGLRRGYDAARDSFHTTAARFDVGCQACHGPASGHVAWESSGNRGRAPGGAHGFDVSLASADGRVELETCARCHARRAPLGDGYDARHRLMDDYEPSLLADSVYFADGQILAEDYEYGSFVQSRMHAVGVRCSDCHEPHRLALRAPGDALCQNCHRPGPAAAAAHIDVGGLKHKDYGAPEHHHHRVGEAGSHCVDCHMPTRTYMVVDPRHDHSIRIPRPDLSAATGAPNACNGCHADRSTHWAAETVARWYGPERRPDHHFGEAIASGRAGRAGAASALLQLAADADAPAIARATAITLLDGYPSASGLDLTRRGLADPDPLVRMASVTALAELPPRDRVGALALALTDSVRAVRIEAARALAAVGANVVGEHADALARALAEYEGVQRALAERPESHVNLGTLAGERGRTAEAESHFADAIRLDPRWIPAYVNLADLQRLSRGDDAAEATLREALRRNPDAAAIEHALGLTLVRQHRTAQGIASLERAARLEPRNARFGYVYAVALHDGGRPREAVRELERVVRLDPSAREARLALVEYLRESGDADGARRQLQELAAINPGDPALGVP